MKKALLLASLLFLTAPLSARITSILTFPSGSDTAVQFNDGGFFGSSTTFTYTKADDLLSLSSMTITYLEVSSTQINGVYYEWPVDNGTNGQILTSDGAGTLSWGTVAGAGASGNDTEVQFNNAGAFAGDSGLTYNLTTNTLSVSSGSFQSIDITNGNIEISTDVFGPMIFVSTVPSGDQFNIRVSSSNKADSGALQATIFMSAGSEPQISFFAGDGSAPLQVTTESVKVQAGRHLRLMEDSGFNYVGFESSAALSGNQVWVLPGADGSSGHVIQTDGSGVLSFVAQSSAGGGVPTLEVMVNDVQISSPTASIQFSAAFTGSSPASSTSTIGVDPSSVTTFGMNVIKLQNTIQSGATFYASSGTAVQFNAGTATVADRLFIGGGKDSNIWHDQISMTFDVALGIFQFTADPDTDIRLLFTATSNDGSIDWKEDENYFQFENGIVVKGSVTVNNQDLVKFNDADDSNFVALRSSAALAGNQIWILPPADGSANSLLKTDGSGNLSFADATGTGDLGYWNRTGTVLSPVNAGDEISTTGQVTTGVLIPSGDDSILFGGPADRWLEGHITTIETDSIRDTGPASAISISNRQLLADDGSTVNLTWATAGNLLTTADIISDVDSLTSMQFGDDQDVDLGWDNTNARLTYQMANSAHVMYRTGTNVTPPSIFQATGLLLVGDSNSQMSIVAAAASNSRIFFGDVNDEDVFQLDFDHNDNSFKLWYLSNTRLNVDTSGNFDFQAGQITTTGDVNLDNDFSIISDGTAGLEVVIGIDNAGTPGTDNIFIGGIDPGGGDAFYNVAGVFLFGETVNLGDSASGDSQINANGGIKINADSSPLSGAWGLDIDIDVTTGLRILSSEASASGTGAGISFGSSDGAAIGDGHRLGFLVFLGSYDAGLTRNSAVVQASATELWDVNSSGSEIGIGVTPNGTNSRRLIWEFKEDGDLLGLTTNRLNFRDDAIGLYSQADTFLDLFADGAVRIGNSSAGAPTNYVEISGTGLMEYVGDAGLPHISIFQHDTGTTVTLPSASVDVVVDGFGLTLSERITFVATSTMTITIDGRYLINWSASFNMATGTNQQIEATVGENGTPNVRCSAHRTVATATDTGNMGGSCILDLSANDDITLMIRNESAGNNVVIEHANFTILMVGG